MRVIWQARALSDLIRIELYLLDHNPQAAERLADTIYAASLRLASLPERNRAGRWTGNP